MNSEWSPDYESNYLNIANHIVEGGHSSEGRNGITRSLPFPSLQFDLRSGRLPLLTTRKMYTTGILGEYAAVIRGPKHVDDFRRWGCNYWNKWADADGNLRVDYGNAWRDYNGVDQMAAVLHKLRTDPRDRRLLINAWRPDQLEDLSLPCCHYAYQFWSNGRELSLLWHQRSADWAVGVPSDALFAAVMLACFAQLAGQRPGMVKMVFGDAHIYENHVDQMRQQIQLPIKDAPTYSLHKQADLYSFVPEDLTLHNYSSGPAIKYELFE